MHKSSPKIMCFIIVSNYLQNFERQSSNVIILANFKKHVMIENASVNLILKVIALLFSKAFKYFGSILPFIKAKKSLWTHETDKV